MKIKSILKKVVIASLFPLIIVSCKDDDKGADPGPNPKPGKVEMKDVALTGTVYDINGNPLSGVKVTTGTLNSTTGNNGKFTFIQANVVNSRTVIKFEKTGYFTVTRSGVKANEMTMEVVLREKNSKNTTSTKFNANQAQTLSAGGMKATVPANGLVRTDGSAYTGEVKADMLYLDPNDNDFASAMPGGDLAAIRTDNSEVQLISYGMAEISLTDNAGNPLQLKEGETSTLTFPIPAGMESNPPATIPLWYFDDEKGIWVEEGLATLQDGVYVGTINHFSWHNLDVPAERVTIRGKVTNCNNSPVQVKITLTQTIGSNTFSQGYVFSNINGDYGLFVPENTPVTITILSKDYDNDGNPVGYNIAGQPGGTVVTQNFSLPCINVEIKGNVTDCNSAPVPYIKVRAMQTSSSNQLSFVETKADGSYSLFVPAYTPVTVTVLPEDYSNINSPVKYEIEGRPIGTIVTQNISLPCGGVVGNWQQTIKDKYNFNLTMPEGWTYTKTVYDASISFYVQFTTSADDFEKAYNELKQYLFDLTANVTDGNFNMELWPNLRYANYTQLPWLDLWYFNSPTNAIQFSLDDAPASKIIQISINSCGNPAVAPDGTPSGEYTGDETGTGWATEFLTVLCPNITIPQFSNVASFEWGFHEWIKGSFEITVTNTTAAMISDYENALRADGWQYSSIWEEYYKSGIYITIDDYEIAEGKCVIEIKNVNY